jgi:hypothetical protein
MIQGAAFESSMALDASCSHRKVHMVPAAALTVVFHVQCDVSITIKESAPNPALTDLS